MQSGRALSMKKMIQLKMRWTTLKESLEHTVLFKINLTPSTCNVQNSGMTIITIHHFSMAGRRAAQYRDNNFFPGTEKQRLVISLKKHLTGHFTCSQTATKVIQTY